MGCSIFSGLICLFLDRLIAECWFAETGLVDLDVGFVGLAYCFVVCFDYVVWVCLCLSLFAW